MRYPLFFNHGGLVAGRGFLAHVSINGRCVMERTGPDFFSFFGVSPASAAGQAPAENEAQRALLESVRLGVFDIAERASSFDEFQVLVNRFVLERNPGAEQLWSEAVADVRSGKADTSDFTKTIPAEKEPSVMVKLVAVDGRAVAPLDPKLNDTEELAAVAG